MKRQSIPKALSVSSGSWQRINLALPVLIGILSLPVAAQAQQASQGNTTIFGGTQMTFFGNHDFIAGGQGTQPGIIGTVRTAPFGILNVASSATGFTGANDANHVDGYVRKYGTGQFVFPTGDNGHYGPFAANTDGTMGAYFFTDPNTAATSNLAGGTYPALPTGGPFSTASKATNLSTVSTQEYWDIDGAAATTITLTWSTASVIGSLTGNDLSKLTIAGWNGSQWVALPSAVNGSSVLGGSSSLTAGSISTTSAIAPDGYSAYTFAATAAPGPAPDLTPIVYARPSSIHGTSAITIVVDLLELNNVATSGLITVRLSKEDIVSLSLSASATTVNNRPVQNSVWSLDSTSDPDYYLLTTSAVVAASGQLSFGLTGTLTPGPTSGTVTTSAVIIGGSGGETKVSNNSDADKMDYFKN